VHLDRGSWGAASVVLLELTKDGIPAYVDENDRYAYGWPPAPAPGENLRHVFIFIANEIDHPLPPERCFDRVITSAGVTIGIASADIGGCS
jgi:hypothetical protein